MRDDLKFIVEDQLQSVLNDERSPLGVKDWARGLKKVVEDWPSYAPSPIRKIDPENIPADLARNVGNYVAKLLSLPRHVNGAGKRVYDTKWGTKSPEGLGRVIVRLVNLEIISKLK